MLGAESENHPFEMTIDLSSFRHLGEGLYSGLPAVMTEVVSNAWDANASRVDIAIDDKKKTVTITDDGHGMNAEELNDRFLSIGYERRKHQPTIVGTNGRSVMGKKGIGKLSLFAIANTFEVRSRSDGDDPVGVEIDRVDLLRQVDENDGKYFPDPLDDPSWPMAHKAKTGTQIKITKLKGKNAPSAGYIRERLARRFSVLGERHGFRVYVNGAEVTLTDRNYLKYIQFAWTLDKESETQLSKANPKISAFKQLESEGLTGWIGTVSQPARLKDSFGGTSASSNGIVIMVRGRVAHENLLEVLGEARLFSQYVIGEINADDLDDDSDDEDAITSARQMLRQEDPRVRALIEKVRVLVNKIALEWDELRGGVLLDELNDLPSVAGWLEGLQGDRRKSAETLLKKVGQIKLDEESQRAELVNFSVLAFEKLSAQEALSEIEKLRPDDLKGFLSALGSIDEVEAALYHQIVRGRIEVIRAFEGMVEDDDLEVELQKKLFENLWFFDPSWDRVSGYTAMETSVSKFLGTKKMLDKEIEDGRMDIVYRQPAGTHVIIELKRASAKPTSSILAGQVQKYVVGLTEHLRKKHGITDPSIRCFILLNEEPKDWAVEASRTAGINMLRAVGAEVRTYSELIHNAHKVYEEFLETDQIRHRVSATLDNVVSDLQQWASEKSVAE